MSAIQRKFNEAGQKTKAQHTPTPWHIIKERPSHMRPIAAMEIRGGSGGNFTVLHLKEYQEPDARHICLCVNTHERLVEALKDASSLGEIVASVKYYDEKENVLLTREQLRSIEHVFCVANKVLSEIAKGGAE